MAQIHVTSAHVEAGRFARLHVRMRGLPERVVDRDTAVRWLRDGHSMLVRGGAPLLLVEVGDEPFIRPDGVAEAADLWPAIAP
jgi:hypothetical protein